MKGEFKMRQNCQMALAMPTNCVPMNEDEMSYVEGGYALPVGRSLLNKSTCKTKGIYLSNVIKTESLSQMRIAKEIYAHAYLYYASTSRLASIAVTICAATSGLGTASTVLPILQYIKAKSNPINIGGDNAARVKVYNAIWNKF